MHNLQQRHSTMALILFLLGMVLAVTADTQTLRKATRDDALSERVAELTELASRKVIIRLNTDRFKYFVRTPPRNYSVVVLLTTLNPERGCQICAAAYEEYQILVASYKYSNQVSSRLFFALVDFDEAQEVFQLLKLNTAPVFMHFPARGLPKRVDTMDIAHYGFSAEVLSKWVAERTDVQIRVFRPPNYSGILLLSVLGTFVLIVLYVKQSSLDFLYNRTSWGLIALTFILAMLSGQMWNHIRGAPLLHKNPNTGQIFFIHSSSNGQFIVETYIVMMLYAAVVIGVILMAEAKTLTEDVKKRRVLTLVGLAMLTIFFSLLLSIFRSKYNGYPYSFLFK